MVHSSVSELGLAFSREANAAVSVNSFRLIQLTLSVCLVAHDFRTVNSLYLETITSTCLGLCYADKAT